MKPRTIPSTSLTVLPTTMMMLLLFFLPQDVHSYCWQVGWNPYFTEAPIIQQLSLNKVRVIWEGTVENRECVDQFLVKYWEVRGVVMAKNGRERGWLEGYKLSEQVDNMANFTDIEVIPKAPYMFQAIAREDKGVVGGVEYNRSPPILFKTFSSSVLGKPLISGVSNELLMVIGILCLFGIVVVVGIVYKIMVIQTGYAPKIAIVVDDDDDEDDLLEDNEIEDEDKLASYLKTRHIRRVESNVSDMTENPGSRMGSRRVSLMSVISEK